MTFSCRDYVINIINDEINLKPYEEAIDSLGEAIDILEEVIDSLKDDLNKLQSVIALQQAYILQKKIVSVEKMAIDSTDYWRITFADNSTIHLPESIVYTVELHEETGEFTITLSDGQQFVFNKTEPPSPIFPTGIVVLTQEIKFLKNMEITVEFRVNPSNAIFNYDVSTKDCQIALDKVGEIATYSYVTNPELCHLRRIEQKKDEYGNVKEGQYIAIIADNGGGSAYKYLTSLVLSTKDQNGDSIHLSSSVITLERKKDSQLPVVIIQTENKTKISDKETWLNARMKIDGIGLFPDYEGNMGIKGRGNVSWLYPKKPFAIKLDVSSEILGMPQHKRWVLLANYVDRTLIRNHIAFEIAKRTGLEWTPRGQFVEVVLNDIHYGNYYLCEQIKTGVDRVNITEIEPYDLNEESITGGYILEFDTYYDEENQFRSKIFNYPVMIQAPSVDVLHPEQFEYIQNYIDSLEKVLTANNFANTRAYASMIADTTFMDWWIVMELTTNIEADAPRSCFFYKDRLDVLKAGPVWDFDAHTFREITGFVARESLWYAQLFKDPVFVAQLKKRWRTFKPAFEEIITLIEEVSRSLRTSVELNEEMWPIHSIDRTNGDETLSFNDAVTQMSSVYANRFAWLNSQIEAMR